MYHKGNDGIAYRSIGEDRLESCGRISFRLLSQADYPIPIHDNVNDKVYMTKAAEREYVRDQAILVTEQGR